MSQPEEEKEPATALAPEIWDEQNLLEFFLLLLKVDQRLHPENYEGPAHD